MAESVKDSRTTSANRMIAALASRGRRFFEYVHRRTDGGTHTEVAFIKRNPDGKLFLWNEWKCEWIYVGRPGSWKGFHHGGTLHAFVIALVEWIRTGKPTIHPSYFKPSHWGYSAEEMAEIVSIGQEIGAVKQ